jgi:phosphatidylglycerol:prolipoprotein diacylglycerol transferase
MGPLLATISYPPIPIFEVGPLRLSLHGLMAAVGFLVGAMIATREVRRRGFDAVKFQSCLTWALIGALIGARYLTAPAQLMAGEPLLQVLNPVGGNFSIMGGFVGGIVGGLLKVRQYKLPTWPLLDAASFGLALGTVVGRVGDLAIVEHLGRATTAWFGYGIRPGYDVAPQHDALECTVAGPDGFCGIYHHVALYDLLGAAILLGVLFLLSRKVKLRYGQLFAVWMAWYGMQRYLLDNLRYGMGDAVIGQYTWNQLAGFAAFVAGAILFWWLGRHKQVVSPEHDRELYGALPPPASVPAG